MPLRLVASRAGAHPDVERVRFEDDAVASEVVNLRRECEAIGARAESTEFNGEIDGGRIDRCVVPIRIDTKLGRQARFEDRDLQ